MNNPIRVQRKRTKGFKLPENTVCVTRGTKYGNPFKVIDGAIVFQTEKTRYIPLYMLKEDDAVGFMLTNCYEFWVNGETVFFGIKLPDWKSMQPITITEIKQLKGFNIACFCSLDLACHGDVILKIANS